MLTDHGAQQHPAQSNVDIQLGHVLRGTATAYGCRVRIVVVHVAAGQADIREEHLAGRENIAQVSTYHNNIIDRYIIINE